MWRRFDRDVGARDRTGREPRPFLDGRGGPSVRAGTRTPPSPSRGTVYLPAAIVGKISNNGRHVRSRRGLEVGAEGQRLVGRSPMAQHCPGPIPRREFLRLGTLALGGLGLPDLLRA